MTKRNSERAEQVTQMFTELWVLSFPSVILEECYILRSSLFRRVPLQTEPISTSFEH